MPDETELDKTEQWAEQFWQGALSDPKGRFVVSELLDRCGARQPRFLDSDYIAAARRDGRAEIGDLIESEIERYCPDRLLQMMRERRSRIVRAKKKLTSEEAGKPQGNPSGRTALDELADQQKAEEDAKAAIRAREAQANKKSVS